MDPTKTSYVPKLGLCATVLLTRWQLYLAMILKDKLKVESIFAWSDSQIVLSWLVKPHLILKVFLSNHVYQIHASTTVRQWGYIRTDVDPADFASRWMLLYELINHSLYYCGSKFLHDNATLGHISNSYLSGTIA